MEVDMMIFALIIFLLCLLLITVFAFLWYSGLFLQVDIKTCEPPFADLEVAYKYAKGSYRDCGLLFTEAHSVAPHLKCIGVYYDDPQQECSSMRYIIGVILNDKEREVTEELKKDIVSKGFQIATFPTVEHVVYSSFPHRSAISVLIAVNRVIPSFRNYVKEKKLSAYPLIEICDGENILYVAPLSKQEEFFVPESLVDGEEDLTSDQRNDEMDDSSLRELEELPDTMSLSSADSLVEIASKIEELPTSEQLLDSLEDDPNAGGSSSGASTESFEELLLDS